VLIVDPVSPPDITNCAKLLVIVGSGIPPSAVTDEVIGLYNKLKAELLPLT
jgi:hypothetical protein